MALAASTAVNARLDCTACDARVPAAPVGRRPVSRSTTSSGVSLGPRPVSRMSIACEAESARAAAVVGTGNIFVLIGPMHWTEGYTSKDVETKHLTRRGHASRERILDAACELFYRRGVAATSMSDIAQASGTGKGQLYHYFSDKPDLIQAVIAAQTERALIPQDDLLARMTTAEDLRSWGAHAVAQHQRGAPARCPLGALVAELADNHPEHRAALDAGFCRWREALADALRRLAARGNLRDDHDPAQLAEVLLCAYEGGVLLSEVHGDTRSLRLALMTAIDYVAGATNAEPGR